MGNCSATQRSTTYSSGQLVTIKSGSDSKLVVHNGPVLGVAYHGVNKVFTCSDDRKIGRIDLDLNSLSVIAAPQFLLGHSKAVNKVLTFGSNIWSCSRDLSLRMWDAENMTCKKEIGNAHELNIMAVTACTSDTSTIYSGSRDYTVKGWDVESGECKVTYSLPRNIVTTLESSIANPHMLYQGAEDLFVRVWDTRSSPHQPPAQVISGYVYFPVSMDVHSDGHLLATGCKGFDSVGCTVKVWDLRNTAQLVADYTGHSQDVVGCKFSHLNPDLLISASKDGSIRVWDTKPSTAVHDGINENPTGACVASIPHSGKIVSCLAVPKEPDPDVGPNTTSNSFAVGSNDGSIMLGNITPSTGDSSQKYTIDIQLTTAAYFDDKEEAD